MANYKPAHNRREIPIGTRFGRLTVVSEVPKEQRRSRYVREFICNCDCGNTVSVRLPNLSSGNSLSCGCFAIELAHQKSIDKVIGKRFGRLTVLREADDSAIRKTRLLCLCDCGNEKSISLDDLTSGMTRSCGCLRREKAKALYTEDLTGQTFNELTAIKQVEDFVGSNGVHRVQWLWQCSCGKQFKAIPINVKRGMTKSCGHIGKSFAEYEINKLLTEYQIDFEYDKECFYDCVNPETGIQLVFDFIIKKPDGSFFIIEHQGAQHFYTGKKAQTPFGKLQRDVTDKVKKQYCIEHNVQLYETFYNEDYIGHVCSILEENGLLKKLV